MAVYRSQADHVLICLTTTGLCLIFLGLFVVYNNYELYFPKHHHRGRHHHGHKSSPNEIILADIMKGIPKHTWPALVETPPTVDTLQYKSLYEVVSSWNPDTPEQPPFFQETLQHFDYGNPREREIAARYRDAEIPFKIYNVSEFNEVSHLWTDDYLSVELAKMKRRNSVERSKSNHFLYWKGKKMKNKKGYVPPTEQISDVSFPEWLAMAKKADAKKLSSNATHYYFMTGSQPGDHGKRTFIARDLSLFSTSTENFFITKVNVNKGIQCRFGMRGIIAESHFDSGRNMVAMLKGTKRYILNPPRACSKLAIISDTEHPSYRHSVIDWSDLNQASSHDFQHVEAIDTIVHTGEVLYIPSWWFHYIISLDYSIQCNSRSGFPDSMIGQKEINDCFGEGAHVGKGKG